MAELSREQVAEIRQRAVFRTGTTASLCDTVEAAWAELDDVRRELEGELLMESRAAAAELDTLRAIVRDIASVENPLYRPARWEPDLMMCAFCDAPFGADHADDCVWLRARAIYGPQEETR